MEPLASRLRPIKIEDFLGQTHILDPSKPFRRSLEKNQISSTKKKQIVLKKKL